MGGCFEEDCTHSQTKGTKGSLSLPDRTDHIGREGEFNEEKREENSLRKMGTRSLNSLSWCDVCLVCPLFSIAPKV